MEFGRYSWFLPVLVWIQGTILSTVHGNIWRRTLEKEVLHHSIHYLKGQLIVCMKATEGNRGKRKVNTPEWLEDMSLQIDIEIMQNTHNYLIDRVVECRKQLAMPKPELPAFGSEHLFATKSENKILHSYQYKSPRLSQDDTLHDETQAEMDTHLGSFKPVGTPKQQMRELQRTQESTTQTTTISSTTTATTTVRPRLVVNMDDKRVTCDSVSISYNIFQCRNLRVDGGQRLPNMDYCPPHYSPTRWRSMEDMPSTSRELIDFINLCAVFGKNLKVHGYVKDVQVVWGCGETEPRLSWQHGKWTSAIRDNGFLHDLECTFSSDIMGP